MQKKTTMSDDQKRLLYLHRENARLRRRIVAGAVVSDAAAASVVKLAQSLAEAKAEVEQWRRAAQRCVTAWTVVRGGVWDPNGLMDEHVDALRKALGPRAQDRPSTPVGWSDTDWLKHLEEIQQNEAAYHRGPLPERGWD